MALLSLKDGAGFDFLSVWKGQILRGNFEIRGGRYPSAIYRKDYTVLCFHNLEKMISDTEQKYGLVTSDRLHY